MVYEPDQRHAEIVIRELGLECGKAVNSPGSREELNQASSTGDVAAVEVTSCKGTSRRDARRTDG